MNILTAEEALADGLTPAGMLSIARFHMRMDNPAIASRCRRVGLDMARIAGQELGGNRRRPANDNAGASRKRKWREAA